MKKTNLLSIGGIFTAIIATICCIGPLLFLSLGIGSIAAFSMFENYRVYFIVLSLSLIGIAFYFAYKKQKDKCEDESCKTENVSKKTKVGVWFALILTLLVIGFPYLGLTPQTSINKNVSATSEVILKVSEMDCKSCATGLEGTLANIKGVRKVLVNFEIGKATIEYDNKITTSKIFIDLINKNGFTATIEKGK